MLGAPFALVITMRKNHSFPGPRAAISFLLLAACAQIGNAPNDAAFDAGVDAGIGAGADAGTDGGEPACVDHADRIGTFHDVPLVVDGVTRHSFIHVPPSYTCDVAWPLLVDFHGTAAATEADLPEERYALPELLAIADARKFIVVRPRSLASPPQGGQSIYQWDINAGDLARNKKFAQALVAELQRTYNIDPARIYAAGFSNGTNMTAQFLSQDPPLFSGYAFIGGGLWSTLADAPVAVRTQHIYATTGYRDYMHDTLQTLDDYFSAQHFAADRIWHRETNAGHELYGWHYEELWGWLDRGERPRARALSPEWTSEAITTTASFTHLAMAASGDVVAVGSAGEIWRRAAADGSWKKVAALLDRPGVFWESVCLLPSGNGIAVGDGLVASTKDWGATWSQAAPPPDVEAMGFGYDHLNAVGCFGSRMTSAGYAVGVTSEDAGATWSAASVPSQFGGFSGQVSSLGVSTSGTWVAAGYFNYLGRSSDGITFTFVQPAVESQWLYGVAAADGGRWWIVGEKGSIAASTDDGQTWIAQPTPTSQDLYSVSFADRTRGMAVGAHGTALLTDDGGATWRDVSTGLDGFLGDVAWLTTTTALVVGEHGAGIRYMTK